jgi:hypothetical protein
MKKNHRAKQATDDSVIHCICFACRISKGTDTSSEYVILTAFPQRQWLHDHASMLHLHVHCLSSLDSVLSNTLYNFSYSCSIPNKIVMNFWSAISFTSNAHQLITENVWPLNYSCYPQHVLYRYLVCFSMQQKSV